MSLRIVVLGQALSAGEENPAAAFYRDILAALAGRGHAILFLEPDGVVPPEQRDGAGLSWCDLQFYHGRAGLEPWRPRLADADLVLVDTDLPEGVAIARLARASAGGVVALLDRDTPATLRRLAAGGDDGIAPGMIASADLVLVGSGGLVPRDWERRFGARCVRVFYPAAAPPPLLPPIDAGDETPARAWECGYRGDHAPTLLPVLERLLIETARRMPGRRFVVAGAGWPSDLTWPGNVDVIARAAAADAGGFDQRLGWSLVLPRADESATGWTPGPRLFTAAASGTPVITVPWRGLSVLFMPGRDIVVATRAEDVIRAMARPAAYRAAIGRAGRLRVRMAHTPDHRAARLEALVEALARPRDRRQRLVRV